MAIDKKKGNNNSPIHNNNMSQPGQKCNKMRQLNNPMDKEKEAVPVGNRIGDSNWSLLLDEESIMLCFRKDGTFDVVKDYKVIKSQTHKGVDGKHNISSPMNRKLEFGEEKEDEEEETIYISRNQHRDIIRRASQKNEIEDCGMVSAESRDSNQSEGSTGSFAFPVLGLEWIGSPVEMPKSEGLHLRKQKVMRFQCCRF